MASRYQSIKAQSPGLKADYRRAHTEQVERFNVKEGSATDQFFTVKSNEDLHHRRPRRLLDPLFKNTTPEQAQQLSKEVGNVNAINNLLGVEKRGHQGKGPGSEMAVHNLMRERGLTTEAKRANWHPLIQEIEMAGDSHFAYKLHLAKRYNRELKPEIDRALNDSMTHYSEIDTNRAQKIGRARNYKARSITGIDPQIEARWRNIKNVNSLKQLPERESYWKEKTVEAPGTTTVKLPMSNQQTSSTAPMV